MREFCKKAEGLNAISGTVKKFWCVFCMTACFTLSTKCADADYTPEVTLSSSTELYLVGLPAPILFKIKNKTIKMVRVNCSEIQECRKVWDEYGSLVVENPHVTVHYGDPRPDTLWPGDSCMGTVYLPYTISQMDSLTKKVQTVFLPAGRYAMRVAGEMIAGSESNTIEVEVVNPTGIDKKAFEMFDEACDLKRNTNLDKNERNLKAYEKFRELANEYPNSAYRDRALYRAVILYKYVHPNDCEGEIDFVREIIEAQPQSEYMSRWIGYLTGHFRQMKNKEGLLRLLQDLSERYPNTKISETVEEARVVINKLEF